MTTYPGQTFEVHAPETYEPDGCAYSPLIDVIEAPDLATAIQIAEQTYGAAHDLGQLGEGVIVYHGH